MTPVGLSLTTWAGCHAKEMRRRPEKVPPYVGPARQDVTGYCTDGARSAGEDSDLGRHGA